MNLPRSGYVGYGRGVNTRKADNPGDDLHGTAHKSDIDSYGRRGDGGLVGGLRE
jgi:hypothetical protein